MRSPHLYDTLRRFCLGASPPSTATSTPAPTSPSPSRSTAPTAARPSTKYRPLVRGFVEAARRPPLRTRRRSLRRRRSAARAGRPDLRPRARGVTPDESRALYRSVLVPLLVRTAEGCGGFDWDDSAFDRAYAELEESLFGEGHAYGAVAPLVGISCGAGIELGGGIRVRAAATGELAAMLARGDGLLRATSAASPTASACSSSSAAGAGRRRGAGRAGRARRRRHRAPPRDRGPRRRRACALRTARLAPVRDPPGLPIAATAPPGEPTRLDPFRASVAVQLRRCSRSPTTTRVSATRSTAGSSRSSRTIRSAPSNSATRSRPRSATATGPGPPACAPPRCSVRRRRSARPRRPLPPPTLDLVRRLLVGRPPAREPREAAARARPVAARAARAAAGGVAELRAS